MEEPSANKSPKVPTPLDVPRRTVAQALPTAAELLTRLRQNHPRLVALLEEVGLDLAQDLSLWLSQSTGRDANVLTGAAVMPAFAVAAWRRHLAALAQGGLKSVVHLALLEQQFSASPLAVSAALPAGFEYFKTLHVLRQHAGLALHDAARELNWRRPLAFVSALECSRLYLQYAVDHEDLTAERSRAEFTGRLGVSVILSARFVTVPLKQIRAARQALIRSVEQGNSREHALPYLLEAAVREYDICGDLENLELALKFNSEGCGDNARSAGWLLTEVEARLRVADVDHEQRASAVAAARELLMEKAVAGASLAEDQVRKLILGVLLSDIVALPQQGESIGLRGVELPFDGRRPGRGLSPAIAARAGKLAEALRSGVSRGEPLRRAVFADLCSYLARENDSEVAVHRLLDAAEARNGSNGQAPLTDERSRLSLAEDLLLVAQLTGNNDLRARGCFALLLEAGGGSSSPLVMLARNVEAGGPLLVDPSTDLPPCTESWQEALHAGDAQALFASAAEGLLRSRDLARRDLGGRSHVSAAMDYYGVTDETFVVKPTSVLNHQREVARHPVIQREIDRRDAGNVFALATLLAAVPMPMAEEKSAADIVTIYRYSVGRVLAQVLVAEPEAAEVHLTTASSFLGLIHAAEVSTANPDGPRKSLKQTELGRWLRDGLRAADHEGIFSEWWELAQKAGYVKRRDAHAGNWILQRDGRLVAVDLECSGVRPIGYELAQPIDDHPALPPTDMAARRRIFEAYVASLQQQPQELPAAEAL